MCTTCGCGLPDQAVGHVHEPAVDHEVLKSGHTHAAVMRHLLDDNQRRADHNRHHFGEHGVLAVNLMSSPGAGKTTLLEATVQALGDELRIGVLAGDLETDRDAERIRAHGVPAIQITTGQACHLDAAMVHDALHEFALSGLDIVFIENVGNLVCPASFDLGQHCNVVLLSVTEGDDKPAKYPVMFRAADLVLVTKSDLLPHLDDFDPLAAEAALRKLASRAPVLTLSARHGTGMDDWFRWLRTERARLGDARTSVLPRPAFATL